MINILITGAGSVMGQSIYKSLSKSKIKKKFKIFFTNSEKNVPGFFLDQKNELKIDKKIIVDLAKSKYYKDQIKNIIKKYKINLLFSGTQHEISTLSEINNGTFAIIPDNLLKILIDKKKTFEFLDKFNVNVPLTYDFKNYKNKIKYPLVIKPITSSASRNIYVINNNLELNHFKQKNKSNLNSYIIQEYIEGDEYTCGLYVDKIDKSISTIIFKRELGSDGATIKGEITNNKEIKNYIMGIGKIILKYEPNFFGNINIQLRLDKNRGPLLFEINPRLSSTEVQKAHFGFNSVEAYVYNIIFNRKYNFNISKKGKFLRYYDEIYF